MRQPRHPAHRLTRQGIAPRYKRKAALLDLLGVVLLLGFSAAMGCIVLLLSVGYR